MNTKPFIIKRNDTLPSLSISVRTRGSVNELIPFNLSGVTACTFSMMDDSGNLKISSSIGQIISATGGTVQYNWNSEDTDTYGTFTGEFEFRFADGNKLSIPTLGSIDIEIQKDINGA